MSRYLRVVFDVSALTEDEIDSLELEVVVQAEASDGHPDAEVVETQRFDPEGA